MPTSTPNHILSEEKSLCAPFENDEQRLYNALKAEDRHAYNCLYIRIHNMFMPFACKNSVDYDEALGIMIDCMAIFLESVRNGKYEFRPTAKITTYLYSICYYQWLNHLGRRKKRSEISLDFQQSGSDDNNEQELIVEKATSNSMFTIIQDEEGNESILPVEDVPDELLEQADWIGWLHTALAELKEDCQKVLKWFYVEEKSLREISKLLEITEEYAALKRFRCAQTLSKKYKRLMK